MIANREVRLGVYTHIQGAAGRSYEVFTATAGVHVSQLGSKSHIAQPLTEVFSWEKREMDQLGKSKITRSF